MPRGGKREGAGRPSQNKVKLSISIDAEILEQLPKANRSDAINALLRQALSNSEVQNGLLD